MVLTKLLYILTMSEYTFTTHYERFQEWLNQCPAEILDYQDNIETFDIKFLVPLEPEREIE